MQTYDKNTKQTFKTIPDNFECVSSGKGAQNSSKYVKIAIFTYIVTISIFDVF